MHASKYADQFASALPYEKYLQIGSEEQQRRWTQVYDLVHLAPVQQQLVQGFERKMNVLVYSGIWCGDCVQQGPLLQHIVEGNAAKIDMRFVERLVGTELPEDLRINGGSRVPVVMFFSEDWYWCATAGDRTVNRYRALAMSRLGPSCPTGIVAPEQHEVEATVADWLDEFERVQLMLRLTPRLREKYND
jgi:hypothetical protein